METDSNPDQGQDVVAAMVLLPQGPAPQPMQAPILPQLPPLPAPREYLVNKVRPDEKALNIITDVDNVDDNGNQSNNHGPMAGPHPQPSEEANLMEDSLALPRHLVRESSDLDIELPEEETVEENDDALNVTAELIPPSGGQDDTILSGSVVEMPELSSTDPGMSQSIVHRPSSTLAPSRVDCDHSRVDDTAPDSFQDPENEYEFGPAALQETAALAEAAALDRENRKVNMSPPLACSNPGQSAYPKFSQTPDGASREIVTPAGASSGVKLVQKTLFGGVVIPETGVKTPSSSRLRNKVNRNLKVSKEHSEKLDQMLQKLETKRKAENMAANATKLSPPDKLRLAATVEKAKVEIIKDFDEEAVKQQQPDKPITPPHDATGHINLVQGSTPVSKVNSDPEASKEEDKKEK